MKTTLSKSLSSLAHLNSSGFRSWALQVIDGFSDAAADADVAMCSYSLKTCGEAESWDSGDRFFCDILARVESSGV